MIFRVVIKRFGGCSIQAWSNRNEPTWIVKRYEFKSLLCNSLHLVELAITLRIYELPFLYQCSGLGRFPFSCHIASGATFHQIQGDAQGFSTWRPRWHLACIIFHRARVTQLLYSRARTSAFQLTHFPCSPQRKHKQKILGNSLPYGLCAQSLSLKQNTQASLKHKQKNLYFPVISIYANTDV